MKLDSLSLFFWCLWSFTITVTTNGANDSETGTTSKSKYVNLLSLVPAFAKDDCLLHKLPKLQACLTSAGVNPAALVQQDPNSRTYQQLNYQWNEYPEPKSPTAYLVPQTVADVKAAVRCGRKLNIRVVPKGGGHSFEKYSYGDANTLVLDMQMLDTVSIDHSAGTADVGPGLLLGPLAWRLYENGSEYALPSGRCPSVGISLALGGGFGIFPRTWGLTSDAIQELDIVTANGKMRTVNKYTDPYLYWALRGGGGSASFGIVTRFKFQLQKAPAEVAYTLTYYNQFDFVPVFKVWQDLLDEGNLPRTINSVLTVNWTHVTLEFVEVRMTKEESADQTLLAEIMRKFPTLSRLGTETTTLTYPEFILQTLFPSSEFYNLKTPSDLLKINRESFSVQVYSKTKSYFSGHKKLNDRALSQLAASLRTMPRGGNIVIEAFGEGSAINSVPTSATAFVHRDSLYHATVGYTDRQKEGYETEGKQWVNGFYDLVTGLLSRSEAYQNYADADLDDRLGKYYGDHLPRLVAIKRAVDPNNYFRSPESIPIELP